MSHTWVHKGITFVGNGDLSGEITIVTEDGKRFEVLGSALEEFIAARLVSRIVSRMESEDPSVVLGAALYERQCKNTTNS